MRKFCLYICVFSLSIPSFAYAGDVETLTLPACIRMALSSNPDISSARAGQDASVLDLSAARKDLFPSLSAGYSYSRQSADNVMRLPEDYYAYSFTLSQPLYKGNSLVTAVERNRLALEGAGLLVAKARNDVVFSVHEAYYALLRSQKLSDEARQQVERLESHLADAKNFYEAGLIPKNDLLASQVELARGKQDVVKTRKLSQGAAARLNVLLNRPVDNPLFLMDQPDFEIAPLDWSAVLDDAISSRPELRLAALETEQAGKDIILARSRFLPEVTLSASYEKHGDNPGATSYPLGPTEEKTALAVAEWKLWSWGQSFDKVDAARARQRQAEGRARKTSDAVTIEVRQAFLNTEEAAANIEVAKAAVEHAEENYRINRERYQAQIATNSEVLDALSLLSRARLDHYNAVYDYSLALANLRWASGTLYSQN